MNAIELVKQANLHNKSDDLDLIEKNITANPDIMDGLPIFFGTRIPVYIVLDYLSEGQTIETIIKDYPSLETKHIKAALKFAELLSTLH